MKVLLVAVFPVGPAAAQEGGEVFASTSSEFYSPSQFERPEMATPENPSAEERATPASPVEAPPSPPGPRPATPGPLVQGQTQLSPPWVLKNVTVSGNAHISSDKILAVVKAESGILYSQDDLVHDVANVKGMGYFENVTTQLSLTSEAVPNEDVGVAGTQYRVNLDFVVTENPTISQVAFSGNKKLGESTLKSALSQKDPATGQSVSIVAVGKPLNQAKLREAEQLIAQAYQKRGYLDTLVEHSIDANLKMHTVKVTFIIKEGVKSVVSELKIMGTKAYSEKTILGLMKTKVGKPFNADQFKQDLQMIAAYYLEHGYIQFQMAQPMVTANQEGTKVYILIEISEGQQRRFGHTRFSGNRVVDTTDLRKVLAYNTGEIFKKSLLDATIQAMQKLYADKGHLFVQIQPGMSISPATGLVDITFMISEGPLLYVGAVNIKGNHATKTYVLKRESLLKPGDVFNESLAERSKTDMMNLGYLDGVTIQTTPSKTDPDMIDLTYVVQEGKPGSLTAGAAYSSLQGLYGTLGITDMNFLGRAQKLSANFSYGARVLNYSLSWSEPWIDNRWPATLGVTAYDTLNISPFGTAGASSINAYYLHSTGGSISVTPRFFDNVYSANFTYSFSRMNISNVQSPFTSELTPGTSDYSTFGITLARDTRDYIYYPTKGSLNSYGITVAGGPFGGDINYVEQRFHDSFDYTLATIYHRDLVLTTANRFKFMAQFGTTTSIPVYNRYFLGTDQDMRGYQVDQVGAPNGGIVEEVFTEQLNFPIAMSGQRPLVAGHVFYDMGSAWSAFNQVNLNTGTQPTDLMTDVGVGLKFTSPSFPIQIDWGYGFDHTPGVKAYQVNFGMGNLF